MASSKVHSVIIVRFHVVQSSSRASADAIVIHSPQLLVRLHFLDHLRATDWHVFHRWIPFDPARNWPDLGLRFAAGELKARTKARALAAAEAAAKATQQNSDGEMSKSRVTAVDPSHDTIEDDERDLSWATVLKRTFEAYLRGERPNMVSCSVLLVYASGL